MSSLNCQSEQTSEIFTRKNCLVVDPSISKLFSSKVSFQITYTLVYAERKRSDSTLSIQAMVYKANLAIANIALQKNRLNTQFSNNGSIGTRELEIPRVKYTVFLIVLGCHFLPTVKPLKTSIVLCIIP